MWWSMPANTRAEKAARAKAKAEYEAAHPDRTPRKIRGGFAANGTFYPATTSFEKKIAQSLAQAGHPPISPCLTIDEQGPSFVGKSGRTYHMFAITPRTLIISLDYATAEEERTLLQQGIALT